MSATTPTKGEAKAPDPEGVRTDPGVKEGEPVLLIFSLADYSSGNSRGDDGDLSTEIYLVPCATRADALEVWKTNKTDEYTPCAGLIIKAPEGQGSLEASNEVSYLNQDY